MNGVRAGFLAVWAVTAIGAAGMLVAIVSVMAQVGPSADRDIIWMFGALAAVAMTFSSVGLVIAQRQPGNRVAWVLMAAGPLIVTTFSGFAIGALRFAQIGSDDPVGGFAGTVAGAVLGVTLFVAVPLLAILFPDGRLPGPRWRVPVALALVALTAYAVASLVQPGASDAELPANPLGIESDVMVTIGALLAPLLSVGVIAGAVMAIVAVATRFRRAAATERQQLKWFLAAVAAIALLLPLSFNDSFLDASGGFTILDVLAIGSLALLPVADRDCSAPIPAVRHRPDREPDDRLGPRDRDTRRAVRRWGGGPPGRACAGDLREHARRGRVDPRRVRAVPAASWPGPTSGRPPVRPCPVRRRACREGVRRTAPGPG